MFPVLFSPSLGFLSCTSFAVLILIYSSGFNKNDCSTLTRAYCESKYLNETTIRIVDLIHSEPPGTIVKYPTDKMFFRLMQMLGIYLSTRSSYLLVLTTGACSINF